MHKGMLAGIIGIAGIAIGAATLAQQPARLGKEPALPSIKTELDSPPPARDGQLPPIDQPASPPVDVIREVSTKVPQRDPMEAVETFLERNRKEANDAIRDLTQEANDLRKRLERVEAALARWKVVSDALNTEKAPATDVIPPQAPSEEAPAAEPKPEDPAGSRQPSPRHPISNDDPKP